MASGSFKKVLPLVLAHEGGYVNDPHDPGGETNKGITRRVYDAYRKSKGLAVRSMKTIPASEVEEIYRTRYWDLAKCDDLPTGLDYAVFDFAVNSGVGQAAKELQRVLRTGVDGVIGDETIAAACKAANADEIAVIKAYCEKRVSFLRKLKGWGRYGKGWNRRVMGDKPGAQDADKGVIDYATKFARNDLVFPIAKTELPKAIGAKAGEERDPGGVNAEPAEMAVTKTQIGGAAAVGGAAVSVQTVMQVATELKDNAPTDGHLGMLITLACTILVAVCLFLIIRAHKSKIDERA